MTKIKDEIKAALDIIKDACEIATLDLEKHGLNPKDHDTELKKLTVVPTIYKRCFVPCRPGRCNCRATIDGRFSLVFEDERQRCMHEANQEITYLNKVLNDELV
jgi:hypothetical protein